MGGKWLQMAANVPGEARTGRCLWETQFSVGRDGPKARLQIPVVCVCVGGRQGWEDPSLKNMDFFFLQSFLVVIKIANLIYYILIKGKLRIEH